MATLKTNTLTGTTTAGSIAVTGEGNSTTTNLQQGLAKFWIAHTGDNTPTATDSFNVGSITDVGQGNYKYNFTNNFATNEGYWTIGLMSSSGDHDGTFVKVNMPMSQGDILTSSVETSSTYTNSTNHGDHDYPYVNMAGLGDLA